MEGPVGLIYETVAEPEAWDEVVRGLASSFGASAGCVVERDGRGPRLSFPVNMDPEGCMAYAAHFHRLDDVTNEALRRVRELRGRALREADVIDVEAWQRSEIYNDLLVPTDVGPVLTAMLPLGTGGSAVRCMTFFRPPGAGPFPDEAARAYQATIPHLQRAMRLREAIAGQLAAVPAWTSALLDHVPSGVFLLGATGRVLHANAVARAMLDSRDGLLLRDGKLAAIGRTTAPRLEAVVAACLSAAPRGGELLLPRVSGGTWLLSACPLPATSAGVTGVAACRAWAWVTDPAAERPGLQGRLAVLFGLTVAQQRVATALLTGSSPAEIAEARDVALATVRSQVQAVYAKLGVRRHGDLVRLLGEVAAMPRPRHRQP